MKNLNTENYKRIFMEHLDKELPLYTRDRDVNKRVCLEYNPEEIWKQCYSPDSKERSQFKPFWFISNKGHLAGVDLKSKKVYLIRRDESNSGYYFYKSHIELENGEIRQKNIKEHILVALVFGSLCYGKAQDILKERGIFSFGLGYDDLNCHHLNGDIKDNRPENLLILTNQMHKLIDQKMLKAKASDEEVHDYLLKLSKEIEKEESYHATVVMTGQMYDRKSIDFVEEIGKADVYTVDSITLPVQMKAFPNLMKEFHVLKVVSEELEKKYGFEFFLKKRCFSVNDILYEAVYETRNVQNGNKSVERTGIHFDRVEGIENNRNFIVCHVTDEEIKCYMDNEVEDY